MEGLYWYSNMERMDFDFKYTILSIMEIEIYKENKNTDLHGKVYLYTDDLPSSLCYDNFFLHFCKYFRCI